MYIKNKLAFIEAPIQCVLLKNLFFNSNNLEIFIIKRDKWPTDTTKFEDYLSKYSVKTCKIFTVFKILFFERYKYNEIIIGSHLGITNKLFIILSCILNYKVEVLDDGLYSIFSKNWMNFISKIFKKLRWISYYNRNLEKDYIVNYCLTSDEKIYNFKDTCILVLTDLQGFNISEKKEKILINYVKNFAKINKMKLLFFPHRRGRYKLYKRMKLEVSEVNQICFEDWYLKSRFRYNCKIFATGSSIWRVLEDKKIKTTLIDLGFKRDNWIKNNNLTDDVLDMKEIKESI